MHGNGSDIQAAFELFCYVCKAQLFNDGNKRTARILTNYNLCKQNKAPIVISGRETDEYFGYIDDYNIDGFTKFLETKSKEELQVMMSLYMKIRGDGSIYEEEHDKNSVAYVYKKSFN